MRVGISFAAITVIGLGAFCLFGCSPEVATVPPTPKPAPAASSEAAATCAMLSIIDSSTANAIVGLSNGAITTEAYAAIINTIPDSLNAVHELSQTYPIELESLIAAVAITEPTVEGARFNPDGTPYRTHFQALRDLCEGDGNPIVVIPNYAGG